MSESIILGLIQGITEWLPVSSQGLTALSANLLYGTPPEEALKLSLWLHLGTALAALIAFREKIYDLSKDFVKSPTNPSQEFKFLLIGTAVSATIAFSIIVGVYETVDSEYLDRPSTIFSAIVGFFMTITGLVQLTAVRNIIRPRSNIRNIDGLLIGIAQGVAILPGISRSGLTLCSLLVRGFDKKDALTLSFLLGIPASIGGSIYGLTSSEISLSVYNLIAVCVSFITGLITIRLMLNFAAKINFGVFVFTVGILLTSSSLFSYFNTS